MFFGFTERPAFLDRFKDIKIKREKMNVCSRNKGKCRGSLPRKQSDGTVKVMYAYDSVAGDLVFDDGIWITKCTADIGGATFSWTEE